MRTETEILTRAYLRRRREYRRQQRLIALGSVAGILACMAYLVYLEWPVLMA